MDKTRPKGPANENHQGRVKPNRRMNEAASPQSQRWEPYTSHETQLSSVLSSPLPHSGLHSLPDGGEKGKFSQWSVGPGVGSVGPKPSTREEQQKTGTDLTKNP